ncbi:NADH-flavin reductase [Helicobacter pullorum]|uniref:NADH-flavin reductase n=1 Tax=Helicobacter pullorum TaxID=35818 RepID=A0AAW3J3L3_9HELI|nr:NAD(P)-dependent oxidoreductase [Helicobacter pullorum]KPH49859.1 NADH-flavin reductase [Helicobacter pullorum]
MKIAVLCASGKAGKLIVEEAINKGLEVSAFVRDSNKARFDSKVCVVQKDIFALESSDLQGFDVIIDAFGEWQNLSLHKAHMEHLVQILSGNRAKFLAVGGAGSLHMDTSHTTMLMDTPDFPKEYLPVARATAETFDVIKASKGINWLYVSPPAVFIPDAPKSGKYKIIGEEFELNSKGESKISYADYAIAMIEIALDSTYSKQRVGVIGL